MVHGNTEWKVLESAKLPSPANTFGHVTLNNKIFITSNNFQAMTKSVFYTYFSGGWFAEFRNVSNETLVFTPETESWSVAGYTTPRRYAAASVVSAQLAQHCVE